MRKWREELARIMNTAGFRRPPALRRSSRSDCLLATDLPQAADETSVRFFFCEAGKAGWRTVTEAGWIHLDRAAVFEAADTVPRGTPASACCLSMLRRNRFPTVSDGTAERMILKALEEGTAAYDAVCRRLHADWAASLRNHTGIPAVDPRFFGEEQEP